MRKYLRLFRYAAAHRRGWIGILVAMGLSTALSLLQPWPFKILVDHVLGDVTMPPALSTAIQWLPGGRSKSGLLAWIVVCGPILFLAETVLDVALTLAWTRVGRGTVNDLARDLFARIQRRSLLFHTQHPLGDSLSRITGDSWCVYNVVDTLLFAPSHALLSFVATLVIMTRLDPQLTLLAVAVAPFMAGSAWLFGRPLRRAAQARRAIESRIESHVQQTLSGIPVVQAFTREDAETRRFQTYAGEAIRAHQRAAVVESASSLGSGLITTLGTAAVLGVAATRVLGGHLTVGGTLVFLSYLGLLQWQMSTLTAVYSNLQSAAASIDRVIAVLETEDPVRDLPDAARMPVIRGHVSIEHVVFGYHADRPVLRDVSLEAQPGDTIAIVGRTGSGKSTLVSLIPRFFDPASGRVQMDGHDVRTVRLESLRQQIAIVLQEPFLLPISVLDNIRYGRPDATRAQVIAAARAANAHLFIEQLEQQYDTVLGERGATVSGGEQQRIAIARALLRDAPILILDEPSSALDADSERALLDALDHLMHGRTTFVIAHRLSTIRRATRIAVMDDGVIVEVGTHDELLARKGYYERLHRLQYGATA